MTGLTLNPNPPIHGFHQAATQVEAQPVPIGFLGIACIETMELLEDVIVLLRRDARPAVAHRNNSFLTFGVHLQNHFAARW